VEGATLTQKASRVLQLLELEALKARYRTFEHRMVEIKRITGRSLVLLEILETVSSRDERQAQAREARLIPWHLRILVRRLELAADGVWLRIASYPERGGDELTVSVELNSRGVQVLSGAAPARSSGLRLARRSLWCVLIAIGVVLVVGSYDERVVKLGWLQGLAGVIAVVVITLLFRRFRR
jgi:hypothetical protein